MRNLGFLACALAMTSMAHAADGPLPPKPDESIPPVHTGSDRIKIQKGMTADQIVAMMKAKGYRDDASGSALSAEVAVAAPVEVAMAQPMDVQPAFPDRIRIQKGMTADQVEAMMNAKGYRSEAAGIQAAASVTQPLVD